jgi:hypothetical protein
MGGGTAAPRPIHHYGSADLTWRKLANAWALYCIGRSGPIVHVVPDATNPGMWRIKHPNGRLSDMANITWAKDGAIAVALRVLDTCRTDEGMGPVAERGNYQGENERTDSAAVLLSDAPQSVREDAE